MLAETSRSSARTGRRRLIQADAQPFILAALAIELQRGWAREKTVVDVIELGLT